ncbi:MAG: hypothetical protein NVSMB58_36630 [Terriglobales bacterium]
MKIIIIATALLSLALPGFAKSHSRSSRSSRTGVERVHGYTKKNGTHVKGYDRTRKDRTDANNWSTKGNVNPETGKRGTKEYRR